MHINLSGNVAVYRMDCTPIMVVYTLYIYIYIDKLLSEAQHVFFFPNIES